MYKEQCDDGDVGDGGVSDRQGVRKNWTMALTFL